MVRYVYCMFFFTPLGEKEHTESKNLCACRKSFSFLFVGDAIGGRLSQQRGGLSNTKGSYRSSCPSQEPTCACLTRRRSSCSSGCSWPTAQAPSRRRRSPRPGTPARMRRNRYIHRG